MVHAAEVDSNNDKGLHHTRSELQIRELCYPSPLFLLAPTVVAVYFTFFRWRETSSTCAALTFTQISLFNTILAIGKLWFTLLLVRAYFSTSMAKHRALIIGHSFVHRLAVFVQKKRLMLAFTSLSVIADIHFHGVGGRTIGKFRKLDLEVVRQIAHKIFILEFGSNDLVKLAPETVGSELENLVRDLHDVHSVEVVVAGRVLRRRTRDSEEYNW